MVTFNLTQETPFSMDIIDYFSLPKKMTPFFDVCNVIMNDEGIEYLEIVLAMQSRMKYLPNNPMTWKQFFSDTAPDASFKLEATFKFWNRANGLTGFIRNLGDTLELSALVTAHKDDRRFLVHLQNWVEWYFQHQYELMIVNYGPYHFTPLVSIQAFFLAFYKYLNTDKSQLSQSFLSHASPAWYGFVKWMTQTYGVNLLPDAQQIADGQATHNAVERLYKVEKLEKLIEKPKEYFTWGYKSKFLWDLEHIPLFRQVQFGNDSELKAKYEELGGVSEAFIEWIRNR